MLPQATLNRKDRPLWLGTIQLLALLARNLAEARERAANNMASDTSTVKNDELADKIIAALRTHDTFTEEEVKALRAAALFIISMRTAGAVGKWFVRTILWFGWLFLLIMAWKNGTLSSMISNWPHP